MQKEEMRRLFQKHSVPTTERGLRGLTFAEFQELVVLIVKSDRPKPLIKISASAQDYSLLDAFRKNTQKGIDKVYLYDTLRIKE